LRRGAAVEELEEHRDKGSTLRAHPR
jgi:hypothetical protein